MVEHEPSPEKMHLGRFSDGQETVEHGPLHRGRFSEGQEAFGDEDPEKHIRRRYSEGLEHRKAARKASGLAYWAADTSRHHRGIDQR